jgi:hypothetical protein
MEQATRSKATRQLKRSQPNEKKKTLNQISFFFLSESQYLAEYSWQRYLAYDQTIKIYLEIGKSYVKFSLEQ